MSTEHKATAHPTHDKPAPPAGKTAEEFDPVGLWTYAAQVGNARLKRQFANLIKAECEKNKVPVPDDLTSHLNQPS